MITKSLTKVGMVGIGNVLNALMGFIFLTAVAKSLDLETFGKYSLLISLLIMFSKIMDFGTNSTYVANYITKRENDIKNTFFTLKLLLFITSVIISITALMIFKFTDIVILTIFISGLFAYGVNYTLFALFQKDEKFMHIVALNGLPAIIKGITGALILLNVINLDLIQSFGVFALSIFASSLLVFAARPDLAGISVSFHSIKSLFIEALPAGISSLIQEGWPALNNAISNLYSGFANVGIFSLANKISNIFVLVSFSIFTVLLPNNAKRIKSKLGYNFKESALIGVGIIFMALTATIIAKPFVFKVFGSKFEESLQLLGILIFASAITSIHTFYENYFFVEHENFKILVINSTKVVILLLSVLVLMPVMSLRGLAYGNLIAATSALGLSYLLSVKNKL